VRCMPRHSDVIRHWRELGFPPGGSNEELSDITADLALRDAEVADIVLPMENAGHDRDTVWPVIDLLAEVDGIISRLSVFKPSDEHEDDLRQWQLDYATALREVYVDALARRTH
jgi:hypothetical protein